MIRLCLIALFPSLVLAQTPTPYVTFFETYIQHLESLPTPPGSIIVTGNSYIRLWSTMPQDLEPLPVVNRGFGGSSAIQLHYYLDRIVLKSKPSAVIVSEGENETWSGHTPSSVIGWQTKIVARINQAGARAYVIGLKPSPTRWSKWPAFQEVNKGLRDLCGTGACTYIDPVPALLLNGKPQAALYGKDQLHFNEAGYRVFVPVVRAALMDKSLKPNPPFDLVAQ